MYSFCTSMTTRARAAHRDLLGRTDRVRAFYFVGKLVAMCDILPPAVFSRTSGPVKAATIEYIVHLGPVSPLSPKTNMSISPAARPYRPKGSPSRTPRYGHPTAHSSRSLDRRGLLAHEPGQKERSGESCLGSQTRS
jgi:hypothetical protein